MVTNKHVKRCSSLLTIRDIYMRYSHISVRMAKKRKKTDNIKNWQGCGHTGNLIHCWWECKTEPLWKTVWQLFCKVTHTRTIWLNNLFLGVYQREMNTCSYKNLNMNFIAVSLPEQENPRTSLAVQWLRLCVSNAGGVGLIPGQGTKIPHTAQHSQKKKGRKWGQSQRLLEQN